MSSNDRCAPEPDYGRAESSVPSISASAPQPPRSTRRDRYASARGRARDAGATMSVLYWLRRLYSLDTLDTRFTVPADTPLKTATPTDGKDARAVAIANSASPSKWRTPEFFVYYIVFIVAVPQMFKTVIDVSQGWIPGRKVDNSDAQYSSFRDNIPYLLVLIIVHPLLRRAYNAFFPVETWIAPQDVKPSTTAVADARLKQRTHFDYYFALLFITALHGVSAFKVWLILYLNYNIAAKLPRTYIPTATWVFNIAILFANELCAGYPLARIAKFLSSGEEPSGFVLWAEWLDSKGGLIPRWEILFNITVLRLISFNMDYYWSLDCPSSSLIEKKQLDPAALSERDRVAIPAEPSAFNPLNYVAYVLYSPLYLTGPILTFNDYISQQRYPPASLTKTRILLYGIRFLLTLLCMELVLHYIYVVAISKSSPNWSVYTPAQLSMLGFFNLHIIWLKLLIPWRFFRLWALLDGIDPPENMVRCMSNNYSAAAFWRGWHRSFNRWVVRYLYVPLGGGGGRSSSSGRPGVNNHGGKSAGPPTLLSKARAILNFLIVFTFVALWHDINLRLLMWGWLITLFVLPEVIAAIIFPAHRWRSHPTAYRVLCGIGAVGNILMMMIANLVGFAVGIDGLKGLLAGIVGSYSGLAYLAAACAALFVGVQVMFEIREGEKRAGIKMKC